ncbi:MAG TPA: antitoxin MazE family protein [Candidatus Binatia bacterium]
MAKNSSIARSVHRYRARMRHAGLRLVQLWVPDTRARGFAEECRRQSRAATKHRRAEQEVLTWLDQTRDTNGWTD